MQPTPTSQSFQPHTLTFFHTNPISFHICYPFVPQLFPFRPTDMELKDNNCGTKYL